MRMSTVFVLGTITGAVVLLWRQEIGAYAAERTRGIRAKAADGMRSVETKMGSMVDSGATSLRRADEFLQGAKDSVGEALRAGQNAIRPAPTRSSG
jgi:hypothetical protein